MNRPDGVTILVILYAVLTCLILLIPALVLAIALLAGPFVGFGMELPRGVGIMLPLAFWGLDGMALVLVFGASYGIAAAGLWKLRPSARWLALVLAAADFAGSAAVLTYPLYGSHSDRPYFPTPVHSFISIALDSFVIWYLTRPHVKLAFRPERTGV